MILKTFFLLTAILIAVPAFAQGPTLKQFLRNPDTELYQRIYNDLSSDSSFLEMLEKGDDGEATRYVRAKLNNEVKKMLKNKEYPFEELISLTEFVALELTLASKAQDSDGITKWLNAKNTILDRLKPHQLDSIYFSEIVKQDQLLLINYFEIFEKLSEHSFNFQINFIEGSISILGRNHAMGDFFYGWLVRCLRNEECTTQLGRYLAINPKTETQKIIESYWMDTSIVYAASVRASNAELEALYNFMRIYTNPRRTLEEIVPKILKMAKSISPTAGLVLTYAEQSSSSTGFDPKKIAALQNLVYYNRQSQVNEPWISILQDKNVSLRLQEKAALSQAIRSYLKSNTSVRLGFKFFVQLLTEAPELAEIHKDSFFKNEYLPFNIGLSSNSSADYILKGTGSADRQGLIEAIKTIELYLRAPENQKYVEQIQDALLHATPSVAVRFEHPMRIAELSQFFSPSSVELGMFLYRSAGIEQILGNPKYKAAVKKYLKTLPDHPEQILNATYILSSPNPSAIRSIFANDLRSFRVFSENFLSLAPEFKLLATDKTMRDRIAAYYEGVLREYITTLKPSIEEISRYKNGLYEILLPTAIIGTEFESTVNLVQITAFEDWLKSKLEQFNYDTTPCEFNVIPRLPRFLTRGISPN